MIDRVLACALPRWVFAAIAWLPAIGFAQSPFNLVDQSHVFPGRIVTSAPVSIAGAGAAVAVSVQGGTYSIGCAESLHHRAGRRHRWAIHLRSPCRIGAGGSRHRHAPHRRRGLRYFHVDLGNEQRLGAHRRLLPEHPEARTRRRRLAFWEAESARVAGLGIDINETWRAVAIAFFASPEYRSYARSDSEYVADLYRTFFSREPDAAGLAHWNGEIAAGIPRAGILLSFLFSGEFTSFMQTYFGPIVTRAEADMVMDFYRGLMQRLPDSEGFVYWRNRFREAQCQGSAAVLSEVEAISSLFLGSAEYAGRNRPNDEFVADLYNGFLRRAGDAPGFAYWTDELASERQTREQLRRAFMGGPEFRQRVARVVNQHCLPLLAAGSGLVAGSVSPGASPFIALVELQGSFLERISSVRFSISPKPDSASRPVTVTLAKSYLARTGHGLLPAGSFRIPVFGLYAGYANAVTLVITFDDGSSATRSIVVPTAPYADPAATYDRPTILTRRAPGDPLGFDFIYAKSRIASPVIIDTDGEIRWILPALSFADSSLFDGTSFVIGSNETLDLYRVQFDGTVTPFALAGPYAYFHHNMEPGKFGYLGEVDARVGGVVNFENLLVEFDPQGAVIKEWDLGAILSSYMAERGDDPSPWIRLGVDWFHMNSAVYDPRDDSLVISSRENFVIKIDYETGAPRWILGDPTKYWYTLPSLRSLSLTVPDAGFYPIGQHGLYVLDDGRLLLFNNGMPSFNQPPGTAAGETRAFSAVSAYTIDPVARTATETYRFEHGRTIFSNFCSSAYPMQDSMLVTYSFAEAGAKARLAGLNGSSEVVFDFEYPSANCNVAWNAEPIELHDLQLR